ncbi:hypothetical protein C8A05DRAFT_32221 [Staphylotrichum tortipilum]|uniref:Uncharacterized protein n=1 Tax=Staphylotrichum tortipilum TaxID=2831512 RepID=A0AAN6MN79_9PEZI|nr:hypothetical protein C8A05DRAFT_32221 [Staphylotrichum longicolle]
MLPTTHPLPPLLEFSSPFHPTVLDLNHLHHLHLNTELNTDMDIDINDDYNGGGFFAFPPARSFSGEPSTRPTPPKPPTPPPRPRPGPIAPQPPPGTPTPPTTP